MNLKSNFILLLGSKVVALLISLLTAGIINRALGPLGRGIYAEMQTWIGLFAVIWCLSIDTTIYHYANRKQYSLDDHSKLLTFGGLSLVIALLSVLAFSAFIYNFPSQVSAETSRYLVLLDVLLVLAMLVASLTNYLLALEQIKLVAFIGVIQAIISSVIIAYGYYKDMVNISYVILNLIIVQTISFAILSVMFLKSGVTRGRFSWVMAKGMIRMGLKQHIATISYFIYTRLNQLIVFKYAGEAEAGIFAIAFNLAFYISIVSDSFRSALFPRVIHSRDEYDVTLRAMCLGFYGGATGILLLMVLAKPIILLYAGEKFLSSVNVFRMWLIAAWFLALSSLTTPFYTKKGAFGLNSFLAVLTGIISLGLNFTLIPAFLATGAAVATAISCFFRFLLMYFFLWYLSKKNPLKMFIPSFNAEYQELKIWLRQGLKYCHII